MASPSLRSPRGTKGALAVYYGTNPIPTVIVFQYNPDSVSRTLQPQISGPTGSGGPAPPILDGPPIQTINFDLDIDATDQLEKQDPVADSMGIHPQLAALELIMYPSFSTVTQGGGPQEAPLTVLILGQFRILPVLLTQYTVQEQAFDTKLNPIRARISLTLRVLTYQNFKPSQKGYELFLQYLVVLEDIAGNATTNNPSILGLGPDLRKVEKGEPKLDSREVMGATQDGGS